MKKTITILMLLFLMTTLLLQTTYAQTWQNVGTAGFSAGEAYHTSIAMDASGTPFVVFTDFGNSGNATVKKFDGTSWVTVGTEGFSAGLAQYTSIAIDGNGTPYVAYSDHGNGTKATVMKYDGSSWVTVGMSGFSIGEPNFISIAINSSGTPYVLYSDGGNGNKATVMKFDGSGWVSVGTEGFSAEVADLPSIAIDESGTPYVVYVDYGNLAKATVMKFDGTSWINVGLAGFSTAEANNTKIAIDGNGIPYVVYMDFGNSYKATVMKFNGTSWINVGLPGFSAALADNTNIAIDGNGTPYVVYQDIGNSNKATVMKFDGTSWVNVGIAGFSIGQANYTSIAINNSGTPYVVYQDGGNSYKTTVMKYPPCILNIPDANFKAALLAIPGLDANSDNEIECTEAEAWTGTINVSSKGIHDLTGIEHFTQITYLDCSNNSLISLNVTANINLTRLYCDHNSLASLNISTNTALLSLNCGSNILMNLDVAFNTALRYLFCFYNSLSSLNVSSNPTLMYLNCSYNLLTTLDVSHNTALNSMVCNENSLTSLNLKNQNNTQIMQFDATNNYSLTCIQVDDVAWANANWAFWKDAGASFNTDCGSGCINPSITSQSTGGQAQCINGTFDPISVAASGTNITYQWFKNTSASNSGGTTLGSANGAQTETYTPQANVAGTLYYYCVVTGDCGTPQTSAVSGAFVVTSTLPTVDAGTYTNACLQGSGIQLTGTPSGGEWSGVGVDLDTFYPSWGTQVITYTYTDPATGCTNSDVATITVGDGPVTQIVNQPICVETYDISFPVIVRGFQNVGASSLTMRYDVNTLGTPTLESVNQKVFDNWLYDFDATPLGYPAGTMRFGGNGTGFNLDDGDTLFTIHFHKATPIVPDSITFNDNHVQGTYCEYAPDAPGNIPFCDKPTNTYYIGGTAFLNSIVGNTIATPSQTICNNEAITLVGNTATSPYGGVISYQWQISSNGTNFSDIGLNTKDYTTDILTQARWYKRIATSTLFGNVCTNESPAIKISLFDVLVVGSAGTNQTICYGESPSALEGIAPTGGSSTIAYQWQIKNGLVWNNVLGANALTFAPGSLTTTSVFRLLEMDTWCSPDDTVITNSVTITVHGQLTGGTATADQTICTGTTPSAVHATTPSGGGGPFSYQWQVWNGSGWDDILNETTLTYALGTLNANTTYRLKQTDTYCNPYDVVYTNEVTISMNARVTLSGDFKYYKNANSVPSGPVTGILLNDMVTVSLYQNGTAVEGTQTHSNPQTLTPSGAYYFENLCPLLDYEIKASTIRVTEGAINATDAALVNYWSANYSLYNIEYGRFFAGDVSSNDMMSGTDAIQIRNHFVYGDNFIRQPQAIAGHNGTIADWVFWKEGEITIGNSNQQGSPMHYPKVTLPLNGLTQNIWALCVGDFNTSFNPSYLNKTASNTVDLVYSGNQMIHANQVFDLPIRVVNQSTVGAVSLIMNFPSNNLEVQNVVINGTSEQADWTVNGNEIRIGWYATTPLDLNANDILLTLKLKSKGTFNNNPGSFTLASNPLNELADAQYDVINDAVLSIDNLNATAMGIDEQATTTNDMFINSQPNPFRGATTINYTLPFDGKVTLELFNYMGSLLKVLVDADQLKGNHSLRLDDNNLAAGIYTAIITVKNDKNTLTRAIKIVRSR